MLVALEELVELVAAETLVLLAEITQAHQVLQTLVAVAVEVHHLVVTLTVALVVQES
jgi:hypothetical protein